MRSESNTRRARPGRSPYHAPECRVYGRLRDLTRSGSNLSSEATAPANVQWWLKT